MKPVRTAGSALSFLSEFFRRLNTCFNAASCCYRATETVKAFATGANAFTNRLSAWHTRPRYIAVLWFVRDDLWCRFVNFKLGAHFLDLRGLLFELRG